MSSDKRKGASEVDKHDTPDSTTKERISFYEGDEVFVLQKDGRSFLGVVVEVNVTSEKCLVKFDNGKEHWASFKYLTRFFIPDPEECSVACIVCKNSRAKKNNDVVVCEKCARGYHQKCHQPIIESVKVDWKCKRCRRNKNCQLLPVTKKTVYEDLSYDTTNNSTTSDTQLPELPPTPPSSVSAPETPQPSIVNGEPPTSPIEDPCIDFNDTSTPNQNGQESRCLNLDDLFSDKLNQSQITLPVQLHPVIVDTLVRPTKRRLSEKDIRINRNGEIKRRRFRRQSSLGNLKAVELARPLPKTTGTPVKTVPNGSSADLETVVHSYFSDESKVMPQKKLDSVRIRGEDDEEPDGSSEPIELYI